MYLGQQSYLFIHYQSTHSLCLGTARVMSHARFKRMYKQVSKGAQLGPARITFDPKEEEEEEKKSIIDFL